MDRNYGLVLSSVTINDTGIPDLLHLPLSCFFFIFLVYISIQSVAITKNTK